MVESEIVHEWLAKANDDFEFARENLEEGKPCFAQICFHLQQAANEVQSLLSFAFSELVLMAKASKWFLQFDDLNERSDRTSQVSLGDRTSSA